MPPRPTNTKGSVNGERRKTHGLGVMPRKTRASPRSETPGIELRHSGAMPGATHKPDGAQEVVDFSALALAKANNMRDMTSKQERPTRVLISLAFEVTILTRYNRD